MTEANPCNLCGQMIIFHEGLEKMVNFSDGANGLRGEVHTHRGKSKNVTCNRCNRPYDPHTFHQCPVCFAQVCTKCGFRYQWSIKNKKCLRCLSIFSKTIELTIYNKEQKKYIKKDGIFIQYEIIKIVEDSNFGNESEDE